MAWPLAAPKVVFGWPASEGLQKVRVTAVPDFVTVDQLVAHMAQFGHVLNAEIGRDKLFPAAYDGVVHINIQLMQGATLPNFLAIREEGRTLLNVAYVFSDLHKKACFRCGQLAHLGQYCRAAVKPIADQGLVWSFLDLPAREPVDGHVAGADGPSLVELPYTLGGRPPSPRAGLGVRVEGGRAASGARTGVVPFWLPWGDRRGWPGGPGWGGPGLGGAGAVCKPWPWRCQAGTGTGVHLGLSFQGGLRSGLRRRCFSCPVPPL